MMVQDFPYLASFYVVPFIPQASERKGGAALTPPVADQCRADDSH